MPPGCDSISPASCRRNEHSCGGVCICGRIHTHEQSSATRRIPVRGHARGVRVGSWALDVGTDSVLCRGVRFERASRRPCEVTEEWDATSLPSPGVVAVQYPPRCQPALCRHCWTGSSSSTTSSAHNRATEPKDAPRRWSSGGGSQPRGPSGGLKRLTTPFRNWTT